MLHRLDNKPGDDAGTVGAIAGGGLPAVLAFTRRMAGVDQLHGTRTGPREPGPTSARAFRSAEHAADPAAGERHREATLQSRRQIGSEQTYSPLARTGGIRQSAATRSPVPRYLMESCATWSIVPVWPDVTPTYSPPSAYCRAISSAVPVPGRV